MSHFTLTIHIRTGHFGTTGAAERAGVARILHLAAQEIGSGAAPTPLKDGGGHVVGRYEFGPGMICGPGKGFDETYRNVPSVLLGGSVAPRPPVVDASAPDDRKPVAAAARERLGIAEPLGNSPPTPTERRIVDATDEDYLGYMIG